MLCLGSSLRVSPANSMAGCTSMNGGDLVICNLQKTCMNDLASLVIHCKLDDLFVRLMKKLEIPIPVFKLDRWIEIELEETKSGKEILYVNGITENGNTFDLFRNVIIND